jgi:MFS family permease
MIPPTGRGLSPAVALASLSVWREAMSAGGPLRVLGTMELIDSVGDGLLLTTRVLFLTTVVGLSGGQIGLGLVAAGLAAMACSMPLGRLADRIGARRVLLVIIVARGLAVGAYALIDSFLAFLLIAGAANALARGASAVQLGLVARVLDRDTRVEGLAFLRAMANAGFAVGSLAAAVAISIGSREAYAAAFIIDAISFAACAVLVLRLPDVPPAVVPKSAPRPAVLRDVPYLAVAVLLGVSYLQLAMLDVGLPLWVDGRTSAPHTTVAVVFALNCVLVVALQVRFARRVTSTRAAATMAWHAGVTLFISCAVFAAAAIAGLPPLVAGAILVFAGVIHVFSELQQAASEWTLSLNLAPEHAQGEYQGLMASAGSASATIGPLVMAGVVAVGTTGWLTLGVVFLIAGALTVPATSWALSTRERHVGPTIAPRPQREAL